MKVLVTGGSGSVGRYVVQHLSAKHDVTALDLVPLDGSDIPFVQADILDPDAMKKALAGFDAVAHLAAIPYPKKGENERVFRINVMGTFNVLEACAENGIRHLVFTSSDSTIGLVFGSPGRQPDYLPLDEAHPTRPEDPYGLSKLAGEEMCRAYARRYGISITILRPCWIWSRDHVEIYRKMVAQPQDWAECLWNYIHVIDAARAFEVGLTAEFESRCEEFFIAAADNGTKLPTRELLSRFFPGVTDLRAPLKDRESLISTAKAERMLGWRPEHTWKEIV